MFSVEIVWTDRLKGFHKKRALVQELVPDGVVGKNEGMIGGSAVGCYSAIW